MNDVILKLNDNRDRLDQNQNYLTLIIKQYFIELCTKNWSLLTMLCDDYVKNFLEKLDANDSCDNSALFTEEDEGIPDKTSMENN